MNLEQTRKIVEDSRADYLIVSGKIVSEIADNLALNVKTVNKMKMKTNAEPANYAIKQNLFTLTD